MSDEDLAIVLTHEPWIGAPAREIAEYVGVEVARVHDMRRARALSLYTEDLRVRAERCVAETEFPGTATELLVEAVEFYRAMHTSLRAGAFDE